MNGSRRSRPRYPRDGELRIERQAGLDVRGDFDGTPDQVTAVEKAYRAYARKVPGKTGDYVMEHTAIVYVMDAQNRFLGALDLSRPAEETAAQLAKKI